MSDFEDYYRHLAMKNRKESTIELYRLLIGICVRTLEEGGMETDPNRIGEKELLCIISTLNGKEQYVKGCVEAFNRCVKYCTGIDQLGKMDILWNRPIISRTFIDNDEFNIMYKVSDPQERMVLVLGAAMGLRRGEIWGLRLTDISGNRMTIYGKGHGAKGLVVRMYISQFVNNEIKNYIEWRNDHSGMDLSDGKFIVYKDVHGNILGYKRKSGIGRIVDRISERAGIKATPHSLRRLFCTELYENGCDDIRLSDLMRHSNTELLKIYINPNEKKNENELEQMTSNLVKI